MTRRLLLSLLAVVLIGSLAGTALFRRILQLRFDRQQAYDAAQQIKRADVQVTVPEGHRREQIALQLEAAGICKAADFMAATASTEGFLFPDTYRFFPNTPAAQVAAAMRADFDAKVGDLSPTSSQVALASIVEREAVGNSDRAVIAGVYSNRLDIGMLMEADPTVQYGKDTNALAFQGLGPSFKFWGQITQNDYHSVISPFNTYLNAGLPPTPIANPGRASIIAAQNPDQSDYLYFYHTRAGAIKLARTLAQHQAQVAADY